MTAGYIYSWEPFRARYCFKTILQVKYILIKRLFVCISCCHISPQSLELYWISPLMSSYCSTQVVICGQVSVFAAKYFFLFKSVITETTSISRGSLSFCFHLLSCFSFDYKLLIFRFQTRGRSRQLISGFDFRRTKKTMFKNDSVSWFRHVTSVYRD